MRLRHTLSTIALCAAAACGGGITVHTDYDPQEMPKFGAWKTYAWLPYPGGKDTREYGRRVAAMVPPAVDATLAANGFGKVEKAPDFLVGWHAGVSDQLDVNEINSYYGYGWGRWFPGGGVAYSQGYIAEYGEGTLIIDVVDAKSNDLVWRGRASTELRKLKTDADLEKTVSKAVGKILEEWPPRGKAKAPTKSPGKSQAPKPAPRTRPPA